jgi:c-di-GMP-binding flagellar brake protein YcgR
VGRVARSARRIGKVSEEIVEIMSEAMHALKVQQLRAGARVNSRVRVTLEWEEAGETHSVSGYTVDISPKGCLAVVPQGFAVGQKMRLRNSINGNESEAKLIWRGHEGRSGWELGLELDGPPNDFWGLEF